MSVCSLYSLHMIPTDVFLIAGRFEMAVYKLDVLVWACFFPSFLVTSCCVLLSYQKLHLTIPLMSMLVMGHKFWKKNNMFCSPCNALVTIGKAFLLGFVLLRHLIHTVWQFNALSKWQKAYFIPNLYRKFCNDHLTDDLSIHQLI